MIHDDQPDQPFSLATARIRETNYKNWLRKTTEVLPLLLALISTTLAERSSLCLKFFWNENYSKRGIKIEAEARNPLPPNVGTAAQS
jgi:hypothetical protein